MFPERPQPRRTYLWQRPDWPQWRFDAAALATPLAQVHRAQATLQALTQEVITTSAIEGESLNLDAVRSSIARRLGVDIGALAPADRHVDGVVDMVLDATYTTPSRSTPSACLAGTRPCSPPATVVACA